MLLRRCFRFVFVCRDVPPAFAKPACRQAGLRTGKPGRLYNGAISGLNQTRAPLRACLPVGGGAIKRCISNRRHEGLLCVTPPTSSRLSSPLLFASGAVRRDQILFAIVHRSPSSFPAGGCGQIPLSLF